MVFYFTGTGNSLYAARRLESDPISIPKVICQKELRFQGDTIGIVCPIYGHEVPPMVREFLERGKFETEYFYMVLTYGNRHGGAAELAKSLCDACGVRVDYINILLMVDNWLPNFDMDEQRRMDKQIDRQLDAIAADIQARRRWIAPVTEADRQAHQQFLTYRSSMPADAWQHLLTITDACTGCGICEQVCPAGCIRVENGRAAYTGGGCQTCLACAHACPQKAIIPVIPEKNPKARFRNEHVSLKEIISANHQTGEKGARL